MWRGVATDPCQKSSAGVDGLSSKTERVVGRGGEGREQCERHKRG